MTTYSLIGKRLPTIDGRDKAVGVAHFSADAVLPRMLYGKILRSPHPHARISRIDTAKAENLAGVKAVITGKDTPGVKYGIFPHARDQYLLPLYKVRYIGEEVAAVAAIDEETAEEALGLIEVEYDLLKPVFDIEAAMEPEAPRVHDHISNISGAISFEIGDVEKGFRQSYYVRQDHFETAPLAHCQMEPYVAVASYDDSGKLEMWVPSQSPFTKQRSLAGTLRFPMNQIRIHKVFIGGAFGGRSELSPADFCAALLSIKAKRPVKIVYSREETFTVTRQKHPMFIDLKTGVEKDGTIKAMLMKVLLDGGAYYSTGLMAMNVPYIMIEAVFRIPNIKYEGYHIYTNKPIRGAMKGHGGQQGLFAVGSQLDMIAEELGLDPADIRMHNAIREGEKLPSGSQVTSCGLSECIQIAVKESGWKEKRGKLPPGRGIGIGCAPCLCGFPMGVRSSSSAFIKFNEDGQAHLITGTLDNGQGNWTIVVQVAAEELGLPMDAIKLIAADTDITPQDPGTYSMSAVITSANAVRIAAADAKRQIFEIAGEELEANPEDLESGEGLIYVKGSPERGISVKKAIWRSFEKGTPILGKGHYMPPMGKLDWTGGKYEGMITGAYTFGSVVVEVEVERETGQVRVLRALSVHDCGRAINPMAVEGQMEGCIGFGIGQVFKEELLWEGGSLLNPSFVNYQLPLCLDIPEVKDIIVESIDPNGPFGAKEAAETIGLAIVPALANAIYDAIGIRVKSLPITPEKVLEALENKPR